MAYLRQLPSLQDLRTLFLPSLLLSSELAPLLPFLSSCSFFPSPWERRTWKPLRALVCTSRNPQNFNMTPGTYKAKWSWPLTRSETVNLIAKSCLTVRDSMDYCPPGSSVHGISQASILEWVAISSSRVSSWPRDWTCVSRFRQILYHLSHLGSPNWRIIALCDFCHITMWISHKYTMSLPSWTSLSSAHPITPL